MEEGWRDGARLMRTVEKVLAAAGRPMPALELVAALEARGWSSKSRDKPRALSKVLWRHKDRIGGTPTQGFYLRRAAPG